MVATMGSGMSGGLGAGGAAGGMSMGTAFAGAGIALQGFWLAPISVASAGGSGAAAGNGVQRKDC